MYERAPDAAELEASGLRPEDYASDDIEVWPETWLVFNLFCTLQTQWRTGMGGATGLDYNVLFHKMDRMRLSDEQYDEIEEDIRTMEHEALSTMNEKI